MSTTAYYFCSRGHIVAEISNYEFNNREPKTCWCGSRDLAVQFNFGDPELPQLIPAKWLYYGWRWNNKSQKFMKFYVYDVSQLFTSELIAERNAYKIARETRRNIDRIEEIIDSLVPDKVIVK
jgi:hypothetical protein